MSLLNRILVALLILAPLAAFVIIRPLVYAYSPAASFPEARALAEGWAIFSCDPPFERAATEFTMSHATCELRDGVNTLTVKKLPPNDLGVGRWAQQGASFQFSAYETKRFMGKEIEVSITASCESCVDPVVANYSTTRFGNSGWIPLRFDEAVSTQTFHYQVADRDIQSYEDVVPFVVANPQNSDAVLHIQKLTVRVLEE